MIEIDFKPSDQKLRQFGWFGLFGFGIIGIIIAYKTRVFQESKQWTTPSILWGLAIISPIFSLIFPKGLLPIYLFLTLIAIPIGFIISNLILIIIFYFMITPISLCFKIMGRDELRKRIKVSQNPSHWIRCIPPKEAKSYYRQF